MSRKPFPPDVEVAVVVKSRRRCALCAGLKGDFTEKQGQIAHVDKPEDASLENAAFLCFDHHNSYDSKPSQAKGMMPKELKIHRDELYAMMGQPGPWQTPRRRKIGKSHPIDVSVEVFDRRVPTYRKSLEFVRTVVKDLKPRLQDIIQFASDTDEAVFLFDDALAEYLEDMYKRALRLQSIQVEAGRLPRRLESVCKNTNTDHYAGVQRIGRSLH